MATGVHNAEVNTTFESVCRSVDNPRRPSHTQPKNFDKESALFDALCTVDSSQIHHQDVNIVNNNKHSIPLDHHVYDNLSDTWIRRSSKPQPFVRVSIQALPEDYLALGINLPKPSLATVIPAIWLIPDARAALPVSKLSITLGYVNLT